jgi:hypothetical protein
MTGSGRARPQAVASAGTAPICCSSPSVSQVHQCSAILPSSTRMMLIASTAMGATPAHALSSPSRLRPARTHLVLLALGASFGLAACGGSGSSGNSPSNASAASNGTTTVTVTGTVTTSGSTQGGTTATTKNLVVSNTIRGQLLAAGAALHKLPVSDYTGLVKGETYYAYDQATQEHWAGAGLVASKSSTQAQVGNQDDGAYLVFRQKGNGAWRAWDAGIPGGTNFSCAVKPPATVLAVWSWAPGTCHPR